MLKGSQFPDLTTVLDHERDESTDSTTPNALCPTQQLSGGIEADPGVSKTRFLGSSVRSGMTSRCEHCAGPNNRTPR
jgi:hypothetical protein